MAMAHKRKDSEAASEADSTDKRVKVEQSVVLREEKGSSRALIRSEV